MGIRRLSNYLVIFLIFGMLSVSFTNCKNSGTSEEGDTSGLQVEKQFKLAEAEQVWLALKLQNGENYTYQNISYSWIGTRVITAITVNDDTISSCQYTYYGEDGNIIESWIEEGSEIGSHGNNKCLLTIDQIFDLCEEDILPMNQDPFESNIYLDDRGMLSGCYYRDINCADDCSIGYDIENLVFN